MAATGRRSKKKILSELNKIASDELKKIASEHPHVREHLVKFKREEGEFPELVDEPRKEERYEKPDVIYQVSDLVFAHTYAESEEDKIYYPVEPCLSGEEKDQYKEIKKEVFDESLSLSDLEGGAGEEKLREIFEKIVPPEGGGSGSFLQEIKQGSSKKFEVSERTRNKLWYKLRKEVVGLGPLDPLLEDRMNEDIHVLGYDKVEVDHKVFGIMLTDINLGNPGEYKSWLKSITERIGNPVSDDNPIVDSTLPDGSRLNIVYSDDVSVEGPTITIRQFEETPLSVFEITEFRTMSPELVAYLWLCLETNASIAVCGETASGKTTSLNAITALIPEQYKIYSAEDTLEVRPPHDAWQRLLTSEGSGGGSDVDLYDLITTALRSRPDYVLVGEVRGEEARNVFSAMQTGHSTMFTFHAGNMPAFINRFTGDPINVPERFFDNLNIVIFQNFIKMGNKELRRVTAVHEIEGYSERMEGIISRKVFEREVLEETSDSGETVRTDRINFLGYNNSYYLEDKATPTLGYEDSRDVYDELDKRTKIVERALEEGYTSYDETLEVIRAYELKGVEGLPFAL